MRKTLPVIGMACSACSANVENKLRSIAGINEASVNLVGRTATIDFDPAQVSLVEIKKQISDIGYDLVIDNGQIVEMGSYHELLNDKNSKFYSLYIREEEND